MIRNNIMVYIKNITDATLTMFNEQAGKVISVGNKESYVKFRIKNKNYIEFIPNEKMKPFAIHSV